MYNLLGNIFGNTLGAVSNAINTKQTNKTNLEIAKMTNANNRQLVEMQNKAAKEESELAYRRSTAGNQVKLMQQAGMSRAGAINALNGGGSYTPAPVNTSQDQGATMQTADLGALANIGQALEGLSQRKHEKEMQAKQLAVQKEMQEQQLASSERIARLNADTTNRNADNRLNFDREQWLKQSELIDKNIEHITAQIKKTDKESYGLELDNFRKELENENLPHLIELTNSKIANEVALLAEQISIAKEELKGIPFENRIKELEKEFKEKTNLSSIDLTNMLNDLSKKIAENEKFFMEDTLGAYLIQALMFISKYLKIPIGVGF